MSRLKFLSLMIDKEAVKDHSDVRYGDYATTVVGERYLSSFVTSVCVSPTLQHLGIRGLDNLQEKVFQNIQESGSSLKLQSLVLEECPVAAMKSLTQIPFSVPLK